MKNGASGPVCLLMDFNRMQLRLGEGIEQRNNR